MPRVDGRITSEVVEGSVTVDAMVAAGPSDHLIPAKDPDLNGRGDDPLILADLEAGGEDPLI